MNAQADVLLYHVPPSFYSRIARLKAMGGIPPLEDRPALARWYETVRQRPSFDAADVWERMKPAKLLAMIATKLWPWLSVLGLAVCALFAAIWW